jgi:methylthioribulose-1-phosphate dehydratase
VQKERIRSEDIFILDDNQCVLTAPENSKLRVSECTPLFYNAYTMRNVRLFCSVLTLQAGAVLHSHSQNAVLVTFLYKEAFTITGIEMIKGVLKGHGKDWLIFCSYSF